MEKRFIFAISLSFLVMLLWSRLFVQPTRTSQTIAPTSAPLSIESQKTLSNASPVPVYQPQTESASVELIQKNFQVNFVEPLGAIKDVTFTDYQQYRFTLNEGFRLNIPENEFKSRQFNNKIEFVQSTDKKSIKKRFNFINSEKYASELEIEIRNIANIKEKTRIDLLIGEFDVRKDPQQTRFQETIFSTPEKLLRLNLQKESVVNSIKFLGVRDRYFCIIVQPVDLKAGAFVKKGENKNFQIGLSIEGQELNPGETAIYKFRIYLGPQDLKLIGQNDPSWTEVIHYGAFDFISRLMLNLLGFLYSVFRNWGVGIIFLSLAVSVLLFPLTIKQLRSMKEMQLLQPKIEELRKAYKDNPQRLNKEVLELYREHKVNPMGGCLPMILQLPIFFALYQALSRSIVLKGAGFLWIKDLSEPDRLMMFPSQLPIIGNELNILPILMAIGMFVQQKMTSSASGGEAAEQQKLMMIFMPIIFGFIFYKMPSGLVLYWFINSSIMTGYQMYLGKAK